jgi:hypothetical protein
MTYNPGERTSRRYRLAIAKHSREKGRFVKKKAPLDDTAAAAAALILLTCTSTSNSSNAPSQVARRHMSARHNNKRLSNAELQKQLSAQLESPHKKHRFSPSPRFAATPTSGMRQDGRGLAGSPETSRKSDQPASAIPTISKAKFNEVANVMSDRHWKWEITDVKGSGRQVYVREKIVSADGFPTVLAGPSYDTGIHLSSKIYTPCNHLKEPDYDWCKGDSSCHHCQCGCNGNWGDCGTPTKRSYMWSHNVIDAVKCTCTGIEAAQLNTSKTMDGLPPMTPDTLANARRNFVAPIVSRLANESLESAVLELRSKHREMYPDWDAAKPIPLAMSGDARWNTVWGHKALDCTVYIQLLLFDPKGAPVKLSRRTAFALTYHRNGPGKYERTFIDPTEKAVHTNAGACDPLGLGAAAFILMTEYGFDVVRVLHDRDGSGMSEVRRVKAYTMQSYRHLKLEK